MNKFQPMKAPSDSASEELLARLSYPRYISPKIDGLRAVGHDHCVASKTLKRFRNRFVNEVFSHVSVTCLDGELVVGPPTGSDVLSRTNSGVTSFEGEPDVRWHLFDNFLEPSLTFAKRFRELGPRIKLLPAEARKRVVVVEHELVKNVSELLKAEERYLRLGYEGAMVSDPVAHYKFGRSTLLEGYLLKLKRFVDCEVRVTGVQGFSHNTNEATEREDGVKRRSTRKEGLVEAGAVGTIVGWLVGSKPKRIIKLGTGRMSMADRRHYYAHPEELVGRTVKARYFERPGFAPSYPNFQAFQEAVERR